MGVDSPTGSTVGGFQVGELVARGAMGAVYVAHDASGRRVALKLLAPELAADDRFRRRFLRESAVAAALDHPNVVRHSRPVMRAASSTWRLSTSTASDLRELLRRERRLEHHALSPSGLATQAQRSTPRTPPASCTAMSSRATSSSPRSGTSYVCDFGLARHVSSVGSLTGDRGFVGTVDYVAPEQIARSQRSMPRGRVRARVRALRVPGRCPAVRARERARCRLCAPESRGAGLCALPRRRTPPRRRRPRRPRLQAVGGRGGAVELAAAVVGHPDCGRPRLRTPAGVVGAEHALDDHRESGGPGQPVDVLGSEVGGLRVPRGAAVTDREVGVRPVRSGQRPRSSGPRRRTWCRPPGCPRSAPPPAPRP